MKVALSFPGCHRRGGVERVVFECARFLASRDHEVEVFANEWEADTTQPIRYHPVSMRDFPGFLRRASFLERCTEALRESSYDVLNTHGCVCPTGGVYRVHSVHRAWLHYALSRRHPLSPAALRQRFNPLHFVLLRLEARHLRERKYRKVVALSEAVKADVMRFYAVPDTDIEVVPNGFSPEEFHPQKRVDQRTAMRARLGLEPEHIALLFVANELERKGYRTILKAMALLQRPELRLLVVGRPDRQTVLALAAEASVAEQVIVCGPTTDVASFHAAADLFVLPTQYEAFCLAILEALGSGVPVVTTRVPGAQDAIIEGVNGRLFSDPASGRELAETLRPLLEPEILTRLSEQTPATVQAYQWPVVLTQYETVLLNSTR